MRTKKLGKSKEFVSDVNFGFCRCPKAFAGCYDEEAAVTDGLALIFDRGRNMMLKKLSKHWRWTETKSQSLLIGVLLLLLPLLAGLQYRWQGQLSEREEKQLRASLLTAATRFGQDFDQEITTAYAAFLPNFSPAAPSPSEQVATAWEQWQATAPNPQLVQAVYQITPDQTWQLRLTRFDAATRQLEAYEWPVEMLELREQLQTQINQLTEKFRALPDGESQPPTAPHSVEPPLLLYPQKHLMLIPQLTPAPRLRRADETPAVSLSATLVQLNAEYLATSLLPKLAMRHFGETNADRYELAISGGLPQRQLYPAAGSGKVSAANADVSVNFFRLQTNELRERLRQRIQAHSPSEFKLPAHSSGNPPQLLPVPPFMPLIGLLGASDQAAGQWQLHLRHPSGSLATAVAQARRRNLWLSSSILLLLGGSVVLLVRSSQRARRLAQQQMDFVAGVSHELHTPITVIESAAYNLSKGVTRSPEQMQRYGHIIRRQTRQLHEMIEQVLEFAGIQGGRQPYELQPISLRALLDEFVQANQPLLAERGFQLHLDLAEPLPTINADASALRRALQNLLNNAEKYSGASRWLGLRAEVDEFAQPAQVKLALTDRGLGIAASDLPRLFEPFYRGSEARAAQIHGNGLGLSIVQNIVHAHGGTLRVQSEPGAGSAFTICLPLATPGPSAAASPSLQPHTQIEEVNS